MEKNSRQVALALILMLAAPVAAEDPRPSQPSSNQPYSGALLFRTYCSACHGLSATGDGPAADRLPVRPPNLTLIARHNKGRWDSAKMRRIIDGRDPLKGHGGPGMPMWGDAFRSSRENYDERSVDERIRALVDYLESLQEPLDKPRD